MIGRGNGRLYNFLGLGEGNASCIVTPLRRRLRDSWTVATKTADPGPLSRASPTRPTWLALSSHPGHGRGETWPRHGQVQVPAGLLYI